MLAETDRLERLVADLLLLARSDEDGLIMRMQDVDLDDIVTGEIARLHDSKDRPRRTVSARRGSSSTTSTRMLRLPSGLGARAADELSRSPLARPWTLIMAHPR